MNFLDSYQIPYSKRKGKPILSNRQFFVKYPLNMNKRQAKKIEKIIERYRVDKIHQLLDNDDYFLMEDKFNEMIEELKKFPFNNHSEGIMSWLIDRALFITPRAAGQRDDTKSNLHKNRSILLKTLYTLNKPSFLRCFAGNIDD